MDTRHDRERLRASTASVALRALVRLAALVALTVAFSPIGAAESESESEPERTGGPYVPTPGVVVDQMLRIANVGPSDFVVDLGSGDGVIVLTAAREHKARGLGVDIDPALVSRSNAEAKRLGIDDRASFHVQDVFRTDVSRATVVTLYLLPSMMMDLRHKIFSEARPGTRIVSHDYGFDDWLPDDQVTLEVPEKAKVNGVPRAYIYLWIVPEKVAGAWQVSIEGGERYDLTLTQKFQVLEGTASTRGKPARLGYADLRGEEISFSVVERGARRIFRGRASADAMHGTVDLGSGRSARWTAKRVS
jgi:hypothetical protein